MNGRMPSLYLQRFTLTNIHIRHTHRCSTCQSLGMQRDETKASHRRSMTSSFNFATQITHNPGRNWIWLRVMMTLTSSTERSSFSQGYNSSASSSNMTADPKCLDFNKHCGCFLSQCKFSHVRSACKGNHPEWKCLRSVQDNGPSGQTLQQGRVTSFN